MQVSYIESINEKIQNFIFKPKNVYSVEFFNLPIFLGITTSQLNGKNIQNILFKTSFFTRVIFELEKFKTQPFLKSMHVSMSMSPGDFLNYKLPKDRRIYNFYNEIGFELKNLGIFTISEICNFKFHKRFCWGYFTYFGEQLMTSKYFISIGGEFTTYLEFLNKKLDFINFGLIAKYFYNFVSFDFSFKQHKTISNLEFFLPTCYYPNNIPTNTFLNSYSSVQGFSYYCLFSVKIDFSKLKNIFK